MLWDDPNFLSVCNRELNAAVLALESEARTLEQKFYVDVRRAGVVSGVHMAHAAGGIASTLLSGYVTKALAAFDHAIATTGARAEESDLEELRRRIESDLVRRVDSLPNRLSTMLKHDVGGAVWKTIATQSPQNARGLLGRRIENDLAGIRFRSRALVTPARDVFISHAVEDRALALALKSAFVDYLGPDGNVFVSSDLRSIPGGASPTERILAAIKSSPITIAVVTPNFIRSRWLYFEAGIAEGANRLVIPCIGRGTSFEGVGPPLNVLKQGRDLRKADEIVALVLQVCAELRLEAKGAEPATASIVLEARRPALGGGVSPEALRVCETISRESEHANPPDEHWVDVPPLAERCELSMEQMATVIGELNRKKWLIIDRASLGPQPVAPRRIKPNVEFYLQTEAAFDGPFPMDDAKTVAIELLDFGEQGCTARALAEKLGWSPRRMNVALHVLAAEVPYTPKSPGLSPPYAFAHLYVNHDLRAFARRSFDVE